MQSKQQLNGMNSETKNFWMTLPINFYDNFFFTYLFFF
jgi:hypothetical protein